LSKRIGFDMNAFVRLIKGSFWVSVYSRSMDFMVHRTSLVIELLFIGSLFELAVNVIMGSGVLFLSIVARFLLICAALVVFSEEPLWREIKKKSYLCALIKWFAE